MGYCYELNRLLLYRHYLYMKQQSICHADPIFYGVPCMDIPVFVDSTTLVLSTHELATYLFHVLFVMNHCFHCYKPGLGFLLINLPIMNQCWELLPQS